MKKNKKRTIIFFLFLIIFIFIYLYKNTYLFLPIKISWNMHSIYGRFFACDSYSVDGDGVAFLSHPIADSSLMFEGYANAGDGSVLFDSYVGTIVARQDADFISCKLNEKIGEVFVYGNPYFSMRSNRYGKYYSEIINDKNILVDDLRKSYEMKELFLYIFVNTDSNQYVKNPEEEYDILCKSIDELLTVYNNNSQTINVDIYIYFVDEDIFVFSKEFLATHVWLDYEYNRIVGTNSRIILQMGNDTENFSEQLRLTKEEYINTRERMN